MSVDDIKEIDWKHLDVKRVPQYILVGFSLAFLGLILIIIGIII